MRDVRLRVAEPSHTRLSVCACRGGSAPRAPLFEYKHIVYISTYTYCLLRGQVILSHSDCVSDL